MKFVVNVLAEHNRPNMNKNNLIRFAQSLVFLPFVTGTPVPLGSILLDTTRDVVQTVFIEKQNIKADGLLAFNQVMDQQAEDLEARTRKAEAIDSYFKSKGMPLSGMGMNMVLEAEKNNIDWRLLPAIAVIESTGGKFACKKVTHSFLGWGSCKINFQSDEKAIEIVAMNLGGNNPNTDHHYAGKTTKEILQKYNPPSVVPNYAQKVMRVMNAIGEADKTIVAIVS